MHDFHTRACVTHKPAEEALVWSRAAPSNPLHYFAYYFDVKKDNFEREIFEVKPFFFKRYFSRIQNKTGGKSSLSAIFSAIICNIKFNGHALLSFGKYCCSIIVSTECWKEPRAFQPADLLFSAAAPSAPALLLSGACVLSSAVSQLFRRRETGKSGQCRLFLHVFTFLI